MSGLLGWLFGSSPSDTVLLNMTLEMAQDWGEDLRKPIQARMRERYPWLSERQLDGVDTTAQEAMKYSHDLVAELSRQHGRSVTLSEFRRPFLRRYPWVNRKNLHRLYNAGRAFAWK